MITLKTLPTATAQEVFDHVAAHLLKQGRKSLHNPTGGTCVYRGWGGTSCAAGCLMSDEEYDGLRKVHNVEMNRWRTLVSHGLLPPDHQFLINDLQRVHDQSDVADWPDRLRTVATNHQLNTNILQQ